jgi:hypothetical protein
MKQPTTVCVTCHQNVTHYRYKLSKHNVAFLKTLVEALERGIRYVHLSAIPVGRGKRDYNRLRYWGLIETKRGTPTDRATKGWWSITAKGLQFYRGKIKVPMYVNVDGGHVTSFNGPDIYVSDIKGYFDIVGHMDRYDAERAARSRQEN